VACWSLWPRTGPAIRRIVLISIDTCRADHLSCYGYEQPTTPRIDALASEGTRFSHAIAPVPMTLPSHCTMLTGVNPPTHGVHDNFEFRLADANVTLAEILAEHDFATGAFVSTFVLDERFGLAQGFDTYDDDVNNGGVHGNERRADATTEAALAWLDAHATDDFFLFVHYYDPHVVYEPPEPFRARFDHPYDGEIAFVDHAVGRVLDRLTALDLDASTLVIVTADHGEMLGDHGENAHSFFIYQGAIHVPLIFRLPTAKGDAKSAVISGPVGIIDIVPTVCGLLEIDPPGPLQGEDLTSVLRAEGSLDADRMIYAESFTPQRYGANALTALVGRRWKLIQTTRPELYDVTVDPDEASNVATVHADVLEELQEALDDMIDEQRQDATDSAATIDTAAARRLESIGYTSGGSIDVGAAYAVDPDRSDPKDVLPLHRMHGKVNGLIEEKRYDKARTVCREMVVQHPEFAHGWINLGRIEMGRGDFTAAKSHLLRALDLEPDHADGQNRVGICLTHVGNADAAVPYFETALALDGQFAEAHSNFGVALVQLGRLDEAIDHYRKALDIDLDYPEAHLNLAMALEANGSASDALIHYENAAALIPSQFEARHRLALALASAGRTADALLHFAAAASFRPENANVRFALARALVMTGRSAEALPVLVETTRLKPDWPAALNAQAWILATHADAKVRDPIEALRLAQRAVELTQRTDGTMLDTLAAAYAAAADFDKAVAVSREALALPGIVDGGLADEIQGRLRLYTAGAPYVAR